jgi:hypothetical protein
MFLEPGTRIEGGESAPGVATVIGHLFGAVGVVDRRVVRRMAGHRVPHVLLVVCRANSAWACSTASGWDRALSYSANAR